MSDLEWLEIIEERAAAEAEASKNHGAAKQGDSEISGMVEALMKLGEKNPRRDETPDPHAKILHYFDKLDQK